LGRPPRAGESVAVQAEVAAGVPGRVTLKVEEVRGHLIQRIRVLVTEPGGEAGGRDALGGVPERAVNDGQDGA